MQNSHTIYTYYTMNTIANTKIPMKYKLNVQQTIYAHMTAYINLL